MVMFPAVKSKEGVEAELVFPGGQGYVEAVASRKMSMVP